MAFVRLLFVFCSLPVRLLFVSCSLHSEAEAKEIRRRYEGNTKKLLFCSLELICCKPVQVITNNWRKYYSVLFNCGYPNQ